MEELEQLLEERDKEKRLYSMLIRGDEVGGEDDAQSLSAASLTLDLEDEETAALVAERPDVLVLRLEQVADGNLLFFLSSLFISFIKAIISLQ